MNRRELLAALGLAPALTETLSAIAPESLRLAITTDEVDAALEDALPFLTDNGLRYAEIRNLWGKYNTSHPASEIQRARKLMDAAGVSVAVVDTGFFKVPLPGEDAAGKAALDKQWALLDRAFANAEIFGTDIIRTFAFTHARGEQPDKKNYPRIIELVAESARRAKARGMRLALENVGNSYVATAAHLEHVLGAIPEKALGATWDPNNSAQSGDPHPFPSGYERLDPARIYHVHLRDYRRTPDGGAKWAIVGQGEFDHVGQIRALLAANYRGAFSLETHVPIDGSKRKGSEASIKGLLERVWRV